MGVRSWLARRAVRAARVLVVEGGDGFVARVAVERAAGARGWVLAESPASADALVVAGRVTGELHHVVEGLWDAMPGPRARAVVTAASEVPAVLDEVADRLTDVGRQAEDAAGRTAPDLASGPGDTDHEAMDMAPDGIPLAEGSADDRDGLEMDALPVRLGPVLPHWPAGLVVDVTLHGDLVVDATARLVGGAGDEPDEPAPATDAALRCDEVAAVLALCGWEEGAALARAARDDLLDHEGGDARALLVELRHRVEHARLLRWSLAGVGAVAPEEVDRLGLPEELVGDCRDRLLHLVDGATAAARAYAGTAGADVPAAAVAAPALPVSAFGSLVRGHDLSVARLVIATLGSPHRSAEVVHGA